jgi:hypothetical protein
MLHPVLDLTTHFGKVHNRLQMDERHQRQRDAVEVLGRTSFGDITVRRALAKVGSEAKA